MPVDIAADVASAGPADGSHLPAASAPAEEPIVAVGLKPRHRRSGRHFEPLEDLSSFGIDTPQLALIAFPGGVPKLAIDPGDAGDEATGLYGAEDRACLGIDLMDFRFLYCPTHSDPSARRARIAAAAGRRDRGQYLARLRIEPPRRARRSGKDGDRRRRFRHGRKS